MENWKVIPGLENYEVSNLGRIKNSKTGKILKPGKRSDGYLFIGLKNRKNYTIHSLVARAFLGHVPNGLKITVDHINGCQTDNRPENLELVTNRENVTRGMAKKNTSSQFPGVCWFKRDKKWRAHIRIDGKLKCLGLFTNELEAAQAYQDALKKL